MRPHHGRHPNYILSYFSPVVKLRTGRFGVTSTPEAAGFWPAATAELQTEPPIESFLYLATSPARRTPTGDWP